MKSVSIYLLIGTLTEVDYMCALFFVLLDFFTVFCLNQKPIVLVTQVCAGYDTTQNLGWK